MPLIREFSIFNLFNDFDVRLIFTEDTTIYVGENGMGKTTILYMLNLVLRANLEDLNEFEFDKIKIIFDNRKEGWLNKNDLHAYISSFNRRGRNYIERLLSEKEKKYLSSLDQDHFDIFEEGIENIILRAFNLYNMPRNVAYRELRNYVFENTIKSGDRKKVNDFKQFIEQEVNDFSVLYYPTYRRIEEDLKRLGLEFSNNQINNDLIQFGMKDVEDNIVNLLGTIKNETIKGFNTMTSILLEQYTQDKLEKDEYDIDVNKLHIMLDRIGNQLQEKTKKDIIELISSNLNVDVNLNYRYLMNLLDTMINNYNNQSKLDEKAKNFVDICNSYLIDKRFYYDESNVRLDIKIDSQRAISLTKLSSGEKQVISIFSKLCLSNSKNFIILFDEPELSLSIKWQSKLLPDIMSTGACKQLVAVTHSPFIFDNELKEHAYSMKNSLTHKE